MSLQTERELVAKVARLEEELAYAKDAFETMVAESNKHERLYTAEKQRADAAAEKINIFHAMLGEKSENYETLSTTDGRGVCAENSGEERK